MLGEDVDFFGAFFAVNKGTSPLNRMISQGATTTYGDSEEVARNTRS